MLWLYFKGGENIGLVGPAIKYFPAGLVTMQYLAALRYTLSAYVVGVPKS